MHLHRPMSEKILKLWGWRGGRCHTAPPVVGRMGGVNFLGKSMLKFVRSATSRPTLYLAQRHRTGWRKLGIQPPNDTTSALLGQRASSPHLTLVTGGCTVTSAPQTLEAMSRNAGVVRRV